MLASISPTAPPPRWVMMSLEGSSVSPQPGRRGQWWLMWYWWEISFWWAKHWHVLTRASCYTAQFSILLDTVPNFLPNASKYTSLSVTSSWAFSALRPCPLVVWTTGWRQYIPPPPPPCSSLSERLCRGMEQGILAGFLVQEELTVQN
jgi:hypothetical protein